MRKSRENIFIKTLELKLKKRWKNSGKNNKNKSQDLEKTLILLF
jgi:hypothetical protein